MTKDIHQSTTQLTVGCPAAHVDVPGDHGIAIPTLTILHHPLLRRIGERALLSELLAGRDAKVSRTAPRFTPPRQTRSNFASGLELFALKGSSYIDLAERPRLKITYTIK